MTKILFMGSDAIAIPVLESLRESSKVQLAGILTQPDRPSGRGKKLRMNPVKAWAVDHGIETRDPEKPGKDEVQWLQESGIQLSLVMAYGHMLKRDLLDAPLLGTWNLHASILPLHRGASPIESAILAGDFETGVSLMKIIPRMDAGPVLDIERVTITPADTSPTLREKLSQACIPLVSRNLENFVSGNTHPTEQDENSATYCSKISKEDGRLDFNLNAIDLERRTRAFTPWPGSFLDYGDIRIKVADARLEVADPQLSPGTILSADRDGLLVATTSGAIRFLHLQRPGGRMMEAAAFFLGFEMTVGSLI
jgi:methionyl-tRNA formyltransferase